MLNLCRAHLSMTRQDQFDFSKLSKSFQPGFTFCWFCHCFAWAKLVLGDLLRLWASCLQLLPGYLQLTKCLYSINIQHLVHDQRDTTQGNSCNTWTHMYTSNWTQQLSFVWSYMVVTNLWEVLPLGKECLPWQEFHSLAPRYLSQSMLLLLSLYAIDFTFEIMKRSMTVIIFYIWLEWGYFWATKWSWWMSRQVEHLKLSRSEVKQVTVLHPQCLARVGRK